MSFLRTSGLMPTRVLSSFVLLCFIVSMVITPINANATSIPGLPAVGSMVSMSSPFKPLMIHGLTLHPENPLLIDFIVGKGDEALNPATFKQDTTKLIKYFLASIAIPDNDLWVNLSPYEKDRIIEKSLGETVLGRDMLAQDYLLKQITASLIYPENGLGKKFWDSVYAKAQAQFGTTQIPLNTFNKVWIVADQAKVHENKDTVLVVKSHLKVMLEADYLATQKNSIDADHRHKTIDQMTHQPLNLNGNINNIVRGIIIPALEHEVNTGKNFANLRQIYNAMILGVWFKSHLKQALLNQVYTNKAKINGVDVADKAISQKIYQQYLEAYKKGVFNFIKEDTDQLSKTPIARKYFSGGIVKPNVSAASIAETKGFLNKAQGLFKVSAATNPSQAMNASQPDDATTMSPEEITRLVDVLLGRDFSASLDEVNKLLETNKSIYNIKVLIVNQIIEHIWKFKSEEKENLRQLKSRFLELLLKDTERFKRFILKSNLSNIITDSDKNFIKFAVDLLIKKGFQAKVMKRLRVKAKQRIAKMTGNRIKISEIIFEDIVRNTKDHGGYQLSVENKQLVVSPPTEDSEGKSQAMNASQPNQEALSDEDLRILYSTLIGNDFVRSTEKVNELINSGQDIYNVFDIYNINLVITYLWGGNSENNPTLRELKLKFLELLLRNRGQFIRFIVRINLASILSDKDKDFIKQASKLMIQQGYEELWREQVVSLIWPKVKKIWNSNNRSKTKASANASLDQKGLILEYTREYGGYELKWENGGLTVLPPASKDATPSQAMVVTVEKIHGLTKQTKGYLGILTDALDNKNPIAISQAAFDKAVEFEVSSMPIFLMSARNLLFNTIKVEEALVKLQLRIIDALRDMDEQSYKAFFTPILPIIFNPNPEVAKRIYNLLIEKGFKNEVLLKIRAKIALEVQRNTGTRGLRKDITDVIVTQAEGYIRDNGGFVVVTKGGELKIFPKGEGVDRVPSKPKKSRKARSRLADTATSTDWYNDLLSSNEKTRREALEKAKAEDLRTNESLSAILVSAMDLRNDEDQVSLAHYRVDVIRFLYNSGFVPLKFKATDQNKFLFDTNPTFVKLYYQFLKDAKLDSNRVIKERIARSAGKNIKDIRSDVVDKANRLLETDGAFEVSVNDGQVVVREKIKSDKVSQEPGSLALPVTPSSAMTVEDVDRMKELSNNIEFREAGRRDLGLAFYLGFFNLGTRGVTLIIHQNGDYDLIPVNDAPNAIKGKVGAVDQNNFDKRVGEILDDAKKQIEAKSGIIPNLNPDPAMNGGIDLKGINEKLQSEGAGVKITFDKALIERFKSGDYSGVNIQILGVTPLNLPSLRPLLGLKEEDDHQMAMLRS